MEVLNTISGGNGGSVNKLGGTGSEISNLGASPSRS